MSMLAATLVGAGSSLLSALIQNRSNKMAQRSIRGFTPEEISTSGYDQLYNRVAGADFDRSLYQGYQNTMRGAASQTARIYNQMGNPNLAGEIASRERRAAQASLFEGLSQNNIQRLGMLANIEGARTGIQAQNVQARNAARMNELNLRVQNKMNNPFAEAVGAIGGMAMGYMAQKSGQDFMMSQQRAEDARLDKSFLQQNEYLTRLLGSSTGAINPGQSIQAAPAAQSPSYMPFGLRGSKFLPLGSAYNNNFMNFQVPPLRY